MFSVGWLRSPIMAEAKATTVRTIHLELSEDEATILCAFIQNPPFGCSEAISETKIRENIFTTLKDALEDR